MHLARRAAVHLTDGGSVTLTSGRFAEAVPGSSWGFLVNAGLEAFVHAAAAEMPHGIRPNVVSPGWVAETLEALGEDPGLGTLAAEVARSTVSREQLTARSSPRAAARPCGGWRVARRLARAAVTSDGVRAASRSAVIESDRWWLA
jgi:NAD(P)-dependent dehydrogenase (short-subunit alcohol dehydrogenase family)